MSVHSTPKILPETKGKLDHFEQHSASHSFDLVASC